MNFGKIIFNQSIRTMQNYATWIQTALSFILKLRMLMEKLQLMLKNKLIHQVLSSIDHCKQEKILKNDRINER